MPTTTSSLSVLLILSLFAALCLVLLVGYRHMAQFHKPHANRPVPVVASSLATGTVTPLLHEHDSPDDNVGSVIERVHVIILVHGWVGCPQDLAYLHHALEEQAGILLAEQNLTQEPVYVYTCATNEGKTNDGVKAGGDRIANEIQEFLANVTEQHEGLLEITYSMVGFSLGGLYSRYALPKIIPSLNDKNNNKPRITPKVFCTIATPHLGSKGHTYISLPQRLEHALSWLTQTGRDLFHHTPIIETTVTDPRWIEPLLQFEKRIAYANTYAMDLMVPTSTAAFVTENSTSEHYFSKANNIDEVSSSSQGHDQPTTSHPFMALVVETPAQHNLLLEQQQSTMDHSQRLDAMGWTKVFVDFSKSYRHDSHHPPSSSSSTITDTDTDTTTTTASSSSRRKFLSSELHAEFQWSKRNKLFFPMGHDLVAVNSKNVFLSYATKWARPFIDQLASDLVRDSVLGESSPSDSESCPSV